MQTAFCAKLVFRKTSFFAHTAILVDFGNFVLHILRTTTFFGTFCGGVFCHHHMVSMPILRNIEKCLMPVKLSFQRHPLASSLLHNEISKFSATVFGIDK